MAHFKTALVGLDLNSSRARAAAGGGEGLPQTLRVDGPCEELPTYVSLEGKAVAVGKAGTSIYRRLPHLAVFGFLAHLGSQKQWCGNGHTIDAAAAVKATLKRLTLAFPEAGGVTLALPAYLDGRQIVLLRGLAQEAKLPVLGTVSAATAAATAAHAEQPWSGTAFVLDVDDHALTWAAVAAADNRARVEAVESRLELNLRAWKNRLVNCLADRCVRQSRRDPRDSAEADQSLYDQLDGVLSLSRSGRPLEVGVRTPQWFQNLTLHADELAGFCTTFVRHTRDAMMGLQAKAGTPSAVIVTAAAARLPGLLAALEQAMKPTERRPRSDDWGEELFDGGGHGAAVMVLGDDAVARAAHDLAARIDRGDLQPGGLDVVPLPPPQPVEAGQPRLNFQGKDYVMCGLSFQLGRHPQCDLVFDTETYPTVSAKHCEIVFERRQYVLKDRSKHGTLVNDRPVVQEMVLQPGDWIRLGPQGPLLRFLGQPTDQKLRMTR